jgi:hypothetical protein
MLAGENRSLEEPASTENEAGQEGNDKDRQARANEDLICQNRAWSQIGKDYTADDSQNSADCDDDFVHCCVPTATITGSS